MDVDQLAKLKFRLWAVVEMFPGQTEGHKDTEDVIATLRTQVQYLVFDVEATRRENKYLREMLERRPPGGMHQQM